jgi:hypothetical protein
VTCWEGDHWTCAGVGLIYGLIILVGFPLYAGVSLWTAGSTMETRIQNEQFKLRYIPLWGKFRDECFMFELVEMSRKTLLCGLVHILPLASAYYFGCYLLIVNALLMVSVAFRPFLHGSLNVLYIASQLCTFMTAVVDFASLMGTVTDEHHLVAPFDPSNFETHTPSDATVILQVVLTMTPFLVALCCILHHLRESCKDALSTAVSRARLGGRSLAVGTIVRHPTHGVGAVTAVGDECDRRGSGLVARRSESLVGPCAVVEFRRPPEGDDTSHRYPRRSQRTLKTLLRGRPSGDEEHLPIGQRVRHGKHGVGKVTALAKGGLRMVKFEPPPEGDGETHRYQQSSQYKLKPLRDLVAKPHI